MVAVRLKERVKDEGMEEITGVIFIIVGLYYTGIYIEIILIRRQIWRELFIKKEI